MNLSAQDVADYMLAMAEPESGETQTHLKLQKLLYYCQGLHLAMHGTPIFPDVIENWENGPVVPVLYHKYNEYGGNQLPLPADFSMDKYSPEELQTLNHVFNYYGQFSAWKLRNMTHEELPWLATKRNDVIAHHLLRQHLLEFIEEDE